MRIWIGFLSFVFLVGCGSVDPKSAAYIIGRDPTWFPLRLIQHTPSLNAFTNALTTQIAKSERLPLEVANLPWANLFQALEQKEVGAIYTSLTPNIISEGKYSFSTPFLLLGPVLVVPTSSSVTSLADLAGKIVAVNQFDDSVLIVQRYPTIVIELYQNMAVALEALEEGAYDALLMPNLDAHALVSNLFAGKLKIVSEPLNQQGLRLITLKGQNEKLIQKFNDGLKKAQSSSAYATFRRLYHLD